MTAGGAALSAVIPAYNCAPYLADAIESALAQEGVDHEVIVVDDGSTDETPSIIAKFGERIRAVRQDNRGLSAARNRGISLARGEWIALLDADDTWEPEKSRKQLAYAREHPDCGLVFCDVYRMDEHGRRIAPILGAAVAGLPTGRCLERLILGNFVLVPGVLLRKSVLERVGPFDESLASVEDYDMWLRVAEVSAIGIVPEALASWRERPGQMSRNRDRMLQYEARVLEAALARRPELAGALGSALRRRFARLYDESGWHDLQDGLVRPAVRKFTRALRYDPLWAKPYRHLLAAGAAGLGLHPERKTAGR